MKLNIQMFGGRGSSSMSTNDSKALTYYRNLKAYQQRRLQNTPKDADVTREAINNAIRFADEKINEIKTKPQYQQAKMPENSDLTRLTDSALKEYKKDFEKLGRKKFAERVQKEIDRRKRRK